MFWQVCVLLFVIWMMVKRYKNRKLIRLSNQLKCDAIAVPFLGHSYKFIGNNEDQMKTYEYFGRQAIKYDGITKMWIGEYLFVVVADPVIAECVLKTHFDKSELFRFARDVIGNGSLFAPVPVWRPRRKILAPAFSIKNLNSFIPIFSKQSEIMNDAVKAKAGTGPFSVWNYITTYTLDSVCESTLGVKINAQKNHDHSFLKNFATGSKLVASRILCPWLHSDAVYKLLPSYKLLMNCKNYIKDFTDEIIESTRISLKNKNENNSDVKQANIKSFLELLIESSGGETGYTNVELREETIVLMMAGNDTSAVGSSFVVMMLSRHQNVQEKVYQELKEVFGESSRPLIPEDLPRLKYLDAVIKETLRLYPPIPVILRQCDTDGTIPTGLTLVRGTIVLINIFAVHRNPKYWGPDAEEFRPERFLDTPLKHPAQFMAFSYGPRNCVGYQYAIMSIKTALATLLRQYRLLPDPNADRSIRLKVDIMMKDVDNFTVRIEKRKK